MLIKSLSLKNFQCYTGELDNNHFEFKNGLNLIIGNNGNGKSKVFDGFYWVLYDQIFDTDRREFTSSATYGEKLISDKVTRNCSIGETATTEVCLIVESSQKREYRLTRFLHCTKSSENNWFKEPSTLVIEEKKANRWSHSTESAESVLNRVIPSHIKPYMWFQGEQVDSLMDLTQKTSLSQVINLLSDINIYDELIKITKNGFDKASSNLIKAQKKLSKNKDESERLSSSYDKLTKSILEKEEEITSIADNLSSAKSKIDELINKIDDATRKSQLKVEKEKLTSELELNEQALVKTKKGFTSKIFNDYWILKFCQPSLDKFGDKYKEYFKQHQKIINQKEQTEFKLPINVPQPIHLHGMLEDERCYVCGQDAKKGTTAYSHLEQLVSRSNSTTESTFKCDCSDYFQQLYDKSLRFNHTIETTNDRISKEFDTIATLQTNIQSNREKLDGIESEFNELIDKDNSESIVSAYKRAQSNVEHFSRQKNTAELELSKLKENRNNAQKELERLTVGSVDEVLINSSKVFNSLHKIAESTRTDVYENIITELEMKSNKIFKEMTKSNISFTGNIKLRRLESGACIPEIVDRDGYALTGSNDSNIILVKLSLIMAILTARAKWSDNYTLISDAPTSKMAEEYSLGFYQALGENFSQSIVMTYDFTDLEDRKNFMLSHKKNIGSIHIVKSNYPNGNRDDRTDLETNIEVVSL